jgi:hypothetical protein
MPRYFKDKTKQAAPLVPRVIGHKVHLFLDTPATRSGRVLNVGIRSHLTPVHVGLAAKLVWTR